MLVVASCVRLPVLVWMRVSRPRRCATRQNSASRRCRVGSRRPAAPPPASRTPPECNPPSRVLCGFALIVCVVPHTDDAEAHKSGLRRRSAALAAAPRRASPHPAAPHLAASLTALRRTAVLLRLRATESARVHRYDGVPEWLRCTRAAVFVSTALAASRFTAFRCSVWVRVNCVCCATYR